MVFYAVRPVVIGTATENSHLTLLQWKKAVLYVVYAKRPVKGSHISEGKLTSYCLFCPNNKSKLSSKEKSPRLL